MSILKTYESYLKYPTIVVDFKELGFDSLEEFVEEGEELKNKFDHTLSFYRRADALVVDGLMWEFPEIQIEQ